MIYYLLSTFLSALSNILLIHWSKLGWFEGITKENAQDVMLHLNILNFFTFFIIYFFQKSRGQVHFSIKDTFSNKKELKQMWLFALPVIAAYYKVSLLQSINFSDMAIAAMIKPILVSLLAVIFLKEKLNPKSLKFALLAMIGFTISNITHMVPHAGVSPIFLLSSYVILASVGDITRRHYCRKRTEDLQALFVECTMFAFYSILLMSGRNVFSFKILLHPAAMFLSFLTFMHHFFLVHGVRRASSVIALEFVNLTKPIFTMVLSAIFFVDYPNTYKIIGSIIIAISVFGFNVIEKKSKKIQKATAA